jgi:hypothetical protein
VHRHAYERDLEKVHVALGTERLTALTSEGETLPPSAIPALLARTQRRAPDSLKETRSVAVTD